MAVNALSRYIYAYTPRHSRFTHTALFTQEGPAEVKRLLDQLIPLVRGRDKDEGDLRRQIFHQPMVLSMDNHFPTKDVADFIGQHGFGQVSTICCDW